MKRRRSKEPPLPILRFSFVIASTAAAMIVWMVQAAG